MSRKSLLCAARNGNGKYRVEPPIFALTERTGFDPGFVTLCKQKTYGNSIFTAAQNATHCEKNDFLPISQLLHYEIFPMISVTVEGCVSMWLGII